MSADYRDDYFTVRDGLSLHYRDYPGGIARVPLVCLPGLTRNARDFGELAERLAPAHRVIALDFRGRGLSEYDPAPGRYHPATYAADVIQLLDVLGIERAVFIGTSLGGLVTMIVAVMAGDRIAGAVLNDVGPELDQGGLDRIRSYVGKDSRFRDWGEAGAALAENNQGVPTHYSDDDWVMAARRCCREEGGEIRYDYDMAIAEGFRAANASQDVDLWPMFKALAEKPLLLVRGERSDLLSAEVLEKMLAAASGATALTVAGAGHAPTLVEPESVAAIHALLARVDR